MSTKTTIRGKIIYSDEFGHVCTCTERTEPGQCEGHPAGPFDPMGQTVYCDGSCNKRQVYKKSVAVDRSVAPTESGSWFYRCLQCGASAWSGC